MTEALFYGEVWRGPGSRPKESWAGRQSGRLDWARSGPAEWGGRAGEGARRRGGAVCYPGLRAGGRRGLGSGSGVGSATGLKTGLGGAGEILGGSTGCLGRLATRGLE